MEDIPKLKSKFITTSIGVPCEQDLKNKYRELKEKHGVDMPNWARNVLRREIIKLESRLKKSG